LAQWESFEADPEYVEERFRRGFFDYMEVAGSVAETSFFRHFLGRGDIQRLAASYPTPRKKEEVPLWLYLSSQLTLRLHGSHGFGAYPYVLHCGGLREALGPDQAQRRHDPETGEGRDVFRGFNQKNDYERSTPCDPDFLRKLAKDTRSNRLQGWFNSAVPEYLGGIDAFDKEGIFILDGSYLFVPDNERYERSAVLCIDEHNHPISQVDRESLPAAAQRRCRFRRCYKAVSLLHTDREKSAFLYAGLRILPGNESETPSLKSMVPEIARAAGRGVIKVLLHDRGFIDGEATSLLKKDYGIDSVFPLKKTMTVYEEAWRLCEEIDTPWQIYLPPPPAPATDPPERPDHIRRREEKRRATRKEKHIGPIEPRVDVVKLELKAVREHRTWESCAVPIHVVLIREYRSDGTRSEWALATTMRFSEPLEIFKLYEIRTAIEERHRQLKCFWDLSSFRSTAFSLVVNQVVFVLLAYTLMQVFLKETENGKLSGTTRERLLQQLLPHEDKVYVYCDGRFAVLTGLELLDWALSVREGARRRMRGTIQRLRNQIRKPPETPRRPPRP
jgi:hypothetical protein